MAKNPQYGGMTEIAAQLNINPNTLRLWKMQGLLPDPAFQVSGRDAYDIAEVRQALKGLIGRTTTGVVRAGTGAATRAATQGRGRMSATGRVRRR